MRVLSLDPVSCEDDLRIRVTTGIISGSPARRDFFALDTLGQEPDAKD